MPRRAPEPEPTIAGCAIADYLDQAADPTWGPPEEDSLRLTWEAFRRFKAEVGDERQAAVLALAWAALHGGLHG